MIETNLSDLLDFTRDGEWGEGEPAAGLVRMRVIRGTDFARVRHGDLTTLPVRYIRQDVAARKALSAGDVLIETAGGTKDQPTGRTVLISQTTIDHADAQLIPASFARFLRPKPKPIDPAYLFWKLQAEYHSGRLSPYHVQHTGVARFQFTQFASTHLFEIAEDKAAQREAARTLSAFDDKIELNRRMNETLEAMAQAIFRDWFVDFGPVRRKMEGATDTVAIMGGLTPDPARAAELAALFPAALDEGGLPEGWSERPLDQIADFLNGLALQKFPATPGEPSLPVIKIAELRNGVTDKSNRASLAVPEKYLVNDGDYLFSWSGSLVAKVWTEGKGALNQHLFKVSSSAYPQWFYGAWVERHLPEFQRIAASKATTMGHIQRSHLTAATTVCPPLPTLEKMSSILAPLWDRRIHNDLESRTLAETRDYLLPSLMSGAVRVGEDTQRQGAMAQ